MKHMLIMLVSMLAAASGGAVAATPVYDGTVAGNQAYGEMLGNDFTVNTAVYATGLGVFDDQMNGLSTDISVGLYDTADWSTVATYTFTSGIANGGTQFIWQSIAPVLLEAGHSYSIQARGFNGLNLHYNTNAANANNGADNNNTTPIVFNTFGGALSNQESRWGGALAQAGNYFANSSTFGAGSLQVAAVPEPETYVLMLSGLVALGVVARSRQGK